MQTETISTAGGFIRAQGTEARVCRDIADRQSLGLRKYGTTVEQNPLRLRQWLQHAYEETLDQAIYLKRAMEEMDKQAIEDSRSIDKFKLSDFVIDSWCKGI